VTVLTLPTAREAPRNYDAEMAVLGGIMSRAGALDTVRSFLKDEHFADDRHGAIYRGCCVLQDRGEQANPITLKNWAEASGVLDALGGAQYLLKLTAGVITVVNLRDYALSVIETFKRRAMLGELQVAIDRLYGANIEDTAATVADSVQAEIGRIAEDGVASPVVTLLQATDRALADAEAAYQGRTNALLSGINALDDALGGMYPQDLLVLAGRPGMGKTALAMTIARNVAVRGQRVMIFSLEMGAAALARRLLCADAGVSVHAVRRGTRMTQENWDSLIKAKPGLDLPILIDDRPGQLISAMRAKALSAKRRGGLALVIVDHIGKVAAPPEIQKHGLTAETTHVSGGLKHLAKELDCPVIALSQLSRAVEGRDDKRPNLADLRQSGSIEQDADAVMMLYREAYYLKQKRPKRAGTTEAYNAELADWETSLRAIENEAEVALPKVRDGEPTTVNVRFDPKTISFGDEDATGS
jgi:replicative DNA helicase